MSPQLFFAVLLTSPAPLASASLGPASFVIRAVGSTIDCIDYVTGIENVIQAPPHSVLRANTFSVGQQATNSFDTSTVAISVCPRAWLKL